MSQKIPKVSVIIPCYDVQDFLPECLDSVLNQTLKDFEIICIEDCSNDKTKDILDAYAKQDARIRVFHNKENQRQAISRNIGMDLSCGEYIFFLDSDDTISEDCLETLYEQIIKDDCDIVMGSIKTYADDKNNDACVCRSDGLQRWVSFVPFTKLQITRYNGLYYYELLNCCPVNKLYKKSFIQNNDIRFVNQKCFLEDNGFWLKIMVCNPIISGLSKETYFYRVRCQSSSDKMGSDNIAHALNYQKVLEDAYTFARNKNNKTFCRYIRNEFYKCKNPRLFYFVWDKSEKRLKLLSLTIFGLLFDSGNQIFKLRILGIPVGKWRKK